MRRVCENWLLRITRDQGSWAGVVGPAIVGAEDIEADETTVGRCFSIAPGGFVVVPVLKELPPVMACSEEGYLDVSGERGLPLLLREALAYRLSLYEEIYGSVDATQPRTGEVLLDRSHREQWDRYSGESAEFLRQLDLEQSAPMAQVGPLLTTNWHQRGPYNDLCPMGNGGRSVVGCVPLAAAQIMNYHEHPASGTGSSSYWWNGDDSCPGSTAGRTLSADYSDPYDWANMPDVCSGCSAAEKAALAELCHEVGVAFEIDYGHCETSGYPGLAKRVLRAYFGYRTGINPVMRTNWIPDYWFSFIAEQINAGQPMIYSIAYTATSRHAIVCDGWRVIDGKKQYHINYGWGDSRTAWYTLDNIYHSYSPHHEWLLRDIIPNNPPVALCRDIRVEAGADCRADTSIDSGSYDPDDDPIELSQDPPGPYPLGTTHVTLTVTDSCGATSECSADVTVEDTTPPELAVTLNHYELWPPNHKMVDIIASVEVEDACDSVPVFELTLIESNEPDDNGGDGRTRRDIKGADFGTADTEFRLRSERGGPGTDRIYTITYTATDASGNQASVAVEVRVPHDRSDKPVASTKQLRPNPGSRGRSPLSSDYPGSGELDAQDTAVTVGVKVSPNPTIGAATIRFSLPTPDRVRLRIYDARGVLVRALYDRPLAAGVHEAAWDGLDGEARPMAAGIYFVRLDAGRFSACDRMVLVR
jgi:hypothetical protein